MKPDEQVVRATNLYFDYGNGQSRVHGLVDVSLAVAAGEVVAVMGPSGCGKTTLLHVIGGLDRPARGTVEVAGVDWGSVHGRRLAAARRRTCGFVFQTLALLPAATAAENIEVPLLLDKVPAPERRRRVGEALQCVELADKADHLPDQLSGGQQQRVGIARALVNRPALLLADEPTGSLDSATAEAVTDVLVDAAAAQGTAVLLVTHDPEVARHAHRTMWMHSGRFADNGRLDADPVVGGGAR
ncbi:MAG: ABC transporter ATP-binding protein [Actinomycetota bacterium]|nr:ABC transporter ATP-binding protein [Actinomycetota bacterium]